MLYHILIASLLVVNFAFAQPQAKCLCTEQKLVSRGERGKIKLNRPTKVIAEGAITEEEIRFDKAAAAHKANLCSVQGQNTKPFFRAGYSQPYHLSVGAVLFDQEGRVACHHFKEIFGHKDVYILMRESVEDGEDLLTTLHRGLMEEFGATAKPVAFLGPLSGYLPDSRLPFEKTTLYVACQLTEWKPTNRDANDPEAGSIIEWHDPQKLIALMQAQGEKFKRVDTDESEMIARALPYIHKQSQ